jgi:hypothetical protein
MGTRHHCGRRGVVMVQVTQINSTVILPCITPYILDIEDAFRIVIAEIDGVKFYQLVGEHGNLLVGFSLELSETNGVKSVHLCRYQSQSLRGVFENIFFVHNVMKAVKEKIGADRISCYSHKFTLRMFLKHKLKLENEGDLFYGS